jgi:DNA-binding transcriptional regulator YiaG
MGGHEMSLPTAWSHNGEKIKEPLHYTACGLDDIYLISGYEIEHTPYGDGISIKNLDQLHMAIGESLVKNKKALSAKELRYLRKHMDLTQAELGKLMGLSSQQVARWEKGESEISGSAELLIRIFFIEHMGRTINLQSLATSLAEIDEGANEKCFFEQTDDGWFARKAA